MKFKEGCTANEMDKARKWFSRTGHVIAARSEDKAVSQCEGQEH